MKLNKKVLAGLVALAAASTSAQAVTVAANDGWELGVSGEINQFFVHTNDKASGASNANEVRDGLLPAFINFDMKAPTMNGLDIAAHVSFSPSTNTLSQQGASIEQREVYFTVGGSFGQVLAGKALGLYGSHNILTEQTLFGVGYGVKNNGTTTLGGIGLGYDYADWRSQIKWTSNDMNGFKVAVAIVDPAGAASRVAGGQPTGPLTILSGVPAEDTDLRYEGDLSYTGAFDGGSYLLWLSGVTQKQDSLADDSDAWTVGGTLSVNGFEFMAQYSDANNATSGTTAATAGKLQWDQYVVQAGYRFAGTTLVSVNYSKLNDKSPLTMVDGVTANRVKSNDDAQRWTVGVYHDVNANLKLVAEYTKAEADNKNVFDQSIFSLGGFVFF